MFKEDYIQQLCKSGPEILVYMTIEEIGGFCWRMNHDMADGRIPEKDHAEIDKTVTSAREQQLLLVKSLPNFGVTQPLDETGRPTDEYFKWYRWWNNWHKNELSDEDWDRVNSAMSAYVENPNPENLEALQKFRPKGDWRV